MLSDFYAFLVADARLAALLGGAGRIYRDAAPKDMSAPYITYGVNADGTDDEILDEIGIRVSVFSATAETADKVGARLKAMLDLQDAINIPSAGYNIRWCKQLAGSSMFEHDTRLHNRALVFTLKFTSREA